jgi:hypothetical protein
MDASPLAMVGGNAVLLPDIAGVIHAFMIRSCQL